MKIFVYSDVHWSTNSSLVRGRGDVFSTRLEHLIASMNWVNKTAVEEGCQCMVCVGDFMDKAQLTDEEITALQTVEWNDLPSVFLCGNHESSVSDLRYSSLKAVEGENRTIIDKLSVTHRPECDILYIPYVVESDRKPFAYYLEQTGLSKRTKPLIVFSHNDISGINYAGFESKIGFSIDELKDGCDLYLNGHLHNSEWVAKNVLNVGSLSAHNFTNDSARYSYGAWVLDTDTLKIEFRKNPYGFNFYKFEVVDQSDLDKLDGIGQNAVVTVKCREALIAAVKEKLSGAGGVIESRVTSAKDPSSGGEATITDLQMDHLGKFIEFCRANISNSDILDAELAVVCK